jgi:hypothetical protein
LIAYTIITAWNVGLMVAIARWRGVTSYEGLGMALLALVVGSDYGGLCLALAFGGNSAEVQSLVTLRIWPGLVHLLGILCFGLGLFIVSPNPPKIRRTLSDDDRRQLAYAGSFLAVLGISMKLLALGSEGITSIGQYFTNVYAYNAAQKKLGTFWDWGASIAMFGVTLLAASYEGRRVKQLVCVVSLAVLAFFLTSSRAGIAGAMLMFFVVMLAFNPRTARNWFRPRVLASLFLLLVVSSGIKTQLRFAPGNTAAVRTDWGDLAAQALSTFGTRFGSSGVYSGFANMVDRQSHDHALFMDGRVLAYTLTAWIPHLVFPHKPVHPFRDIGYLIRPNFSSRYDTVYAPTLVGYAWADFGVASVVGYLFLGAFVLGLLRRPVERPDVPILMVAGYLHLMLVEGATNLIHNGFLGLSASGLLAVGSMGLATVYVTVRRSLDAIATTAAAPAATSGALDG